MELDLLKTLVLVGDAGSHAEAARQRGVTPSAISQQLKVLEAQLGVPLFERVGRRSVPTIAAQELIAQLREPFERIERVVTAARSDFERVSGRLTLGSPRPFGSVYLRPRLIALLRKHPDLELVVEFGVPSQLEQDLVEGRLDLAILVTTPEHPSLTSTAIAHETFVAVASPEYLRKHGRPATQDEFLAHRFIVYDRDLAMHRPWWRAAFGARSEPALSIACAVASLPEMQALTEAGLGIAVLPDYLVGPALERGRLEALEPAGASRPARNAIHLGWRTRALPSARLLAVRDALSR
ncbi:MAG: LysR family transcriptional regulator [Myxococcales bacterium]|nr:LysR family transcriptional regulator [Myxococcales bacterium]